jgi:xylulokinase
LYNTEGSVGAARGAGIGVGIYKNAEEAFATLKKIQVISPVECDVEATKVAYEKWVKKI